MASVRNFSIGGAVGIAIGLIGLGFQWKYPEQGWLGKWVAIFGFVILAITLVAYISRSLTIREYERHHVAAPASALPAQQLTQTANPHSEFNPRLDYKPQNVFNPKIDVHVPVSQNVRAKPEPTRDPVFECRGTRFRRYGFDTRTGELIREQYDGDPSQVYDYIKFVDVGLAKFLYRPDPGVDARLRVNAHVFIYGDDQLPQPPLELKPKGLRAWFENKRSCDIYKPIWDDDEPHASVEFSAGYAHELVVALVPAEEQPRGVIGYEYGTTRVESYVGSERVFRPEIYNLKGQRFFVKVELIPKLWNDVRCKLPAFWFGLSLGLPQPTFTFLAMVEG